MMEPRDEDDGASGRRRDASRRVERPVLTALTAVLVIVAAAGVLWRVAGSPTPWRAPTGQARDVGVAPVPLAQPHMPPPETFAEVFSPCAHCHEIGPGARAVTGPPLTGVIGRRAGSVPGYPYSAALRDSGIVWDAATLARFIANPQAVAPGTRMVFGGVPPDEIAALVSYVATIGAQGAVKTLPQSALAIGGPFTLVDAHDAVVTQRDFLGKPSAIFFGYTHCPDVCPTTLMDLTELMKAMGPAADKLNVAFVTVDPERDTPAELANYLSSFDPRIRGLTGTDAQIAAIAKAYQVYYKRVPDAVGAGYSMDHTASVFLMNANGGFAGTLSFEEDPKTSLAKLERLVKAAS
jgi:protein SCO1/2